MHPKQPRSIDHLVLPTATLGTARARLAALGFSVAPDGVHPFGTANCCVYLADGTFLEPLAVADAGAAAAAIEAGNVFVRHQRDYRMRRGDEGLSAVVFATDDAFVDHAHFVAAGLSAGPMLDFSRPFVDASGRSDTASFRLAFSLDENAPDCLFFTCQRVHVPAVDRSSLQRHANGVVRLKAVAFASIAPSQFRRLLETASDATASEMAKGMLLRAANADLIVSSGDEVPGRIGPAEVDDTLLASAIVFAVDDLDTTRAYLRGRAPDCFDTNESIVVPPAPGQGAAFVFEAT